MTLHSDSSRDAGPAELRITDSVHLEIATGGRSPRGVLPRALRLKCWFLGLHHDSEDGLGIDSEQEGPDYLLEAAITAVGVLGLFGLCLILVAVMLLVRLLA